MSGFFQELKQRRVFRVLLTYLVVGWAVIEVADTTFPYLRLPAWGVTLIIALVALGLPVSLVLAWSFQITPEGVRRDHGAGEVETEGVRQTVPWRGRAVWATVVVLAVVAGGVAYWLGRPAPEKPVDANAVVVLPFRTEGASDDVQYLGTGMADLLSVAFTGEVGPRALDARTVLSAWRRAGGEALTSSGSRTLARRLGAGQVLLGEVVGRPSSITVTASLTDATTSARGESLSVTGPVDSLPSLVTALAGKLLGVGAGEARYRIPALAGTPLAAVRAYLQGQEAYRNSRYAEAEDHYRAAMEADSTFALAAIGFRNAAIWEHDIPPSAAAALRLAWRHRDRLAPRDLEYLQALLGPGYPAPSTGSERLEAWERVVARAPDRAEAWFELGEQLFHYGALMDACGDTRDCAAKAQPAFQRAHELAPDWTTPMVHLLDVAFDLGERERGVALADSFLARDPGGIYGVMARGKKMALVGDTATILRMGRDALLNHEQSLWVLSTLSVAGKGIDRPLMLAGFDSAMAYAATDAQRRSILEQRYQLARNRGWPSVASQTLAAMARLNAPRWWLLERQVLDGLYWDGDPAESATAVAELQASLAGGTADTGNVRRQLCTLGQWSAAHDDLRRTTALRDRLRPAPDEAPSYDRMLGAACAAVLDAAAALLTHRADADAVLERADSILRQDPPIPVRDPLNLLLAHLFEKAGKPERALRCAERHAWDSGAALYASTYYRDVARFAAAAGRTDIATDYYGRYLAVRDDPEAPLVTQRDRARWELARLVQEGSQPSHP